MRNPSSFIRAGFKPRSPFGAVTDSIAHVYTTTRLLRSHFYSTSHCGRGGDRYIPADQVSRMLLTFPLLPPKPAYPPPLVGQEALEAYIHPIYLRHWGIYPRTGSSGHTWPGFTRIYNMKDSAMTFKLKFFNAIIEIAEQENVGVNTSEFYRSIGIISLL